MIKKLLRGLFVVVLAAVLFNCCFLGIQYLKQIKEIENYKDVSNMNEFTLGNCVLIRKANGIKTFPFLFGERLYIYDIDKNQWKLVKNIMIPFLGFGHNLAMNNETVYYNKFSMEEGIKLYSKKVSGISLEKEIASQIGLYTVTDNYMYYLKESEAYDEANYLYRKNLKNGKDEIYKKGQFAFVLRQDHNRLYLYDNKKKEALEISLSKNTVEKCKEVNEASWMGYVDKNKFAIINAESIFVYDKRKKRKIYYVKNQKKENKLINDSAILKNKNLYYSNGELQFYRLDLNSGDTKCIFSVKDIDKIKKYINNGDNDTAVNFTKSYITINVSYCNSTKRIFLIYSYEGKLLKEMKLKSLLL